jgi:sulfonate transport system ATP-binding protein
VTVSEASIDSPTRPDIVVGAVPGEAVEPAVASPLLPPGGEAAAGLESVDGAAVVVDGLVRSFGERDVLQQIDLRIHEGEFVALLGRSGSGKSTLLRILAALDGGATGRVLVPARRSVVFQDPRLLPWAKVLRNVTLGQKGKASRQRGLAALAEVGLAEHAGDWPKTLSGGEAQRAALARALVTEPELLLLDEPFGALDALTRIRMQVLLRELCARHHPAVLLVTHDVDEAIQLADRVLVLTDGVLSLDLTIDVPHAERLPGRARYGELRTRLLHELGVDETPADVDDDLPELTPIAAVPDAVTHPEETP